MRVVLFDNTKLIKYNLPDSYEGNFPIKVSKNANESLAVVTADINRWIMKTNPGVQLKYGGKEVKLVELSLGQFYSLTVSDKTYVLYLEKSYENSYQTFVLNEGIKYSVGNTTSDSFIYNTPVITNQKVVISYEGGEVKVNIQNGTFVFKNDLIVTQQQSVVHLGDTFFFYGLRFTFSGNLLIINNPMNLLKINVNGLQSVQIPVRKYEKSNLQISRKDLYTESDYFYKTPRIRRYIETYEMPFASPPSKRDDEEMPLILTIGPMVFTFITSLLTFGTTIYRIASGETTLEKSWMNLVTGSIMLMTSFLWPVLIRRYQKRRRKIQEKKRVEKYTKYKKKKMKELESVKIDQTNILNETYLSVNDCMDIIDKKSIMLWNRQNIQADFLTVRIGKGDKKLDINLTFQEEEFSIEDEDPLMEEARKEVENGSMLRDVPISYSFKENKISAIFGDNSKKVYFLKNLLFQLVTFHSYDDLKIVFMLDENSSDVWSDFKNLPHIFSNDSSVRYYATNFEEMKLLDVELSKIYIERATENNEKSIVETEEGTINYKPYYLIITNDYEHVRKLNINEMIVKNKPNFGFGFIILENTLGKLPSECLDFINLGTGMSETLKNNSEEYTVQQFKDEINYFVDYRKYFQKLFNIPIKIDEEGGDIPTNLTFLEMFQVGRVEQLNSLSRWRLNDPTQSLRALVGYNEGNNKIYLDLHEKAHGPHGLVGGTTGSGKSEFIITYVLSMAVNYSPEEVSFILIDYKGGGLAGAFDNKLLGIKLPHLSGIITNLDKSELNRTLVSINSEITRRQIMFNQARDKLGESTIDIYKYQKLYREGKLEKPIPHLFIISDEFAELKSQQPDFMSDLVSAARIGRSLGIHLILATQKPSGVVNDQIWSNSKFKVCLRVQDRSDSTEMLKRPDAAEIKNPGRFYLQVGYNELFLLAQSGYAGAEYKPSDFTVEDLDNSVVFIDNVGQVIKETAPEKPASNVNANGDQLSNILKYVCNLAARQKLKAEDLWLPSIPEDIYIDKLIQKYNFSSTNICAILGEYDDPKNQKQNILTLELNDDSNTMIYGKNISDRDMFLNAFIYSLCVRYSPEQLNMYVMDFGSETLRAFSSFPQVGDVMLVNDSEKVTKTFSVINEMIIERKKMFVEYNGDYFYYITHSDKKLPLLLFIIHNYEGFSENFGGYSEELIRYARDGRRYGIILIITAGSSRGIGNRFLRNFANFFALEMSSKDEYYDIFGKMGSLYPASLSGRGICKVDYPLEFQTAKIYEGDDVIAYLKEVSKKLKAAYNVSAPPIPVLPDKVTFSSLLQSLNGLSSIPIGLVRDTLDTAVNNFNKEKVNVITAQELETVKPFLECIIDYMLKIDKVQVILIDYAKIFTSCIDKITAYLDGSFAGNFDEFAKYIQNNIVNKDVHLMFVVSGLEKMLSQDDVKALDKMGQMLSMIDNANMIFADSCYQLQDIKSKEWFSKTGRPNYGIWIGDGFSEQTVIKYNGTSSVYGRKIGDKFAWHVVKGDTALIKIVEMDEDEE